jgi:hypothetical protein
MVQSSVPCSSAKRKTGLRSVKVFQRAEANAASPSCPKPPPWKPVPISPCPVGESPEFHLMFSSWPVASVQVRGNKSCRLGALVSNRKHTDHSYPAPNLIKKSLCRHVVENLVSALAPDEEVDGILVSSSDAMLRPRKHIAVSAQTSSRDKIVVGSTQCTRNLSPSCNAA